MYFPTVYNYVFFVCAVPPETTDLCRNASILSYEEFIEAYALRGRPVILKGGASLCFEGGRTWDRESLRKAVGEKVRYSLEQTYFCLYDSY